MLNEIPRVRQIPGEPARRWFTCAEMDLIVWIGETGEIFGFQICYDKTDREKALTWKEDSGFSHMRVSTGETGRRFAKMMPILVMDGTVDRTRLIALFEKESAELAPGLREFVLAKVRELPDTNN